MRLLLLSVALLTTGFALAEESSPADPNIIGEQFVEHRVAPIGIDVKQPRFSWKLKGTANGLRQTVYQIQVALSADSWDKAGRPLLWDSGWVASDQSHLVPYTGKALRSSTPYSWRVRIRNEKGIQSPWSEAARWVTGLLDAEKELRADWIGFDQPHPATPHGEDWFAVGQARWICHPTLRKGGRSVAFYRTTFELPADTTRVTIGMAANFVGQMFLNGIELFQGGKYAVPRYLDVTPWIHPGSNRLAFRITGDESLRIRIDVV